MGISNLVYRLSKAIISEALSQSNFCNGKTKSLFFIGLDVNGKWSPVKGKSLMMESLITNQHLTKFICGFLMLTKSS
jgi:hypothetical protein